MRDLLSNDDSNNNNNNNNNNLASLEAELDLAMKAPLPPPPASAAELIIGSNNNVPQQQQPMMPITTKSATVDLWSTSFSKIEEDFLQADKAKKQTKSKDKNIVTKNNKWDKIDDYDDNVGISSTNRVVPPPLPPGMAIPMKSMPPGMTRPTTATPTATTIAPPGMTIQMQPAPPGMAMPMKMPLPHHPGGPMPPGMAYPAANTTHHHGIIYHPQPPPSMIPRQQPPQPPPTFLLFNNPNPNGKLISIKNIKSSLMKPRDISYILFNLLRSIDPTNDYYFQQYYSFNFNSLSATTTTSTGSSSKSNKKGEKTISEIEKNKSFRTAIVQKSKEWTIEKQVLGVVHKTNIHKPKALLEIDTDKSSIIHNKEQNNNESSQLEKDRKMLWNCRIYIDTIQTQLVCSTISSREEFQKEFFLQQETWKECMTFEKGRKLLRIVLQKYLFPIKECLPDLFICLLKWNPWRTNRSISVEQSRLLQLLHMILCSNNTLDLDMYVVIRQMIVGYYNNKENSGSNRSLYNEVKEILKVFIFRGKEVCSASASGGNISIPQIYEEWNQLENLLMSFQ